MRAELAAAVGGVIAGMNTTPITVTDEETETLLKAADLVTLARTGVEYDYRGDVIDAHAPEMPTRFAKQLAQIVRGAVAIGMDRADALRLAIRCARDSMPPLRLAIIDDLSAHPGRPRPRCGSGSRSRAPRSTANCRRCTFSACSPSTRRRPPAIAWHYSLAAGIDPSALVVPAKSSQKSHYTPLAPIGKGEKGEGEKRGQERVRGYVLTFLVTTSPPTVTVIQRTGPTFGPPPPRPLP